jgi:hypothetical protein
MLLTRHISSPGRGLSTLMPSVYALKVYRLICLRSVMELAAVVVFALAALLQGRYIGGYTLLLQSLLVV